VFPSPFSAFLVRGEIARTLTRLGPRASIEGKNLALFAPRTKLQARFAGAVAL
jgi:hypothetical protein